ncbi:MAG: hypothetical protein H6835_20575, partial [Planctomycetes bacterium]|nr:hypothetical protein [Planctomycetota bacterium]
MRRLLASLSCLLPLSVIALRGAPQDPEAAPPPFRLTVTIDGVEHQLVDGVAKRIELGGKQVALKADVAPLRHFAAAGVEFDYPREMVFRFDADLASRRWTLEARGVAVTVAEVANGTAEVWLDGLFGVMREIGEHAREVESCTVRFGGKELPAKRLSTSLDAIKFEH